MFQQSTVGSRRRRLHLRTDCQISELNKTSHSSPNDSYYCHWGTFYHFFWIGTSVDSNILRRHCQWRIIALNNNEKCIANSWQLLINKSGRHCLFVCFVVRGEPKGCLLFGTASMFEWLRNHLSTTHRGAVRKDGAEIPWGWSLSECFTSSVGL